MAVPKLYSITSLPIASARDVNGVYFVKTTNGFTLLRVANTAGKEWIPFEETDPIFTAQGTKQIAMSSGFAGSNTVATVYDFYVVKSPADYSNNLAAAGGMIVELRGNAAVDLPVSWSQISMIQTFPQYKYGSSGGGVHQIAYPDGGGGPKYRFGLAGSSTWGPWREFALSGSNLFIDNQSATYQSANFKISGDGWINGTMTASYAKATNILAGYYASSASALSVQGGSSAGPTAYSSTGSVMSITGSATTFGSVLGVDNGTGNTWWQAQDINGYAAFYHIALQTLGGNVGVGVFNPTEKLHVVGNGLFSGKVGASRIISGIDNGTTRMSVSASALITGPMTLGSAASTTFSVLSLDGTYGCYMGINDYNGTTYIQSANAGGYSSAYPIVLQPSGGRVGIGPVSTPDSSLHINSLEDALITLRPVSASGMAGFILKENGNAQTAFIQYGNGSAPQFAGEFAMGTILNTQMTFYQGGTAAGNMRMIFDAAAGVRIPGWLRVGGPVGTTPGQTLDVNGTIRQSGATSAMLKSNSSGDIVAATAGTDYLAAGSAILNQSATAQTAAFKINGTGESTTILAAPTFKANIVQPYSGSTLTLDATNVKMSNMSGTESGKAVVADSTGALTAGPILASGSYTPTVTGAGIYSPRGFRYQRIGNFVTVDGLLSCSSLGSITVSVNVTLPIASDITIAEDLTGTVSGVGLNSGPNHAIGDTGANSALVTFAPVGTSASVYVHLSYEIK